ncbi:helix-turn-helix transcriptional regulator [Streptomyces massasporeus]|uniref:helix-turn-helix transcriptional regulator n=1 Tax=Streptomyces massasporeus TaxID=67324 RepID=UPI0037FE4174
MANGIDPSASMAALFGARVRRLRTAAGLTQAELGDRTHVVSTRITQIERASGAKPTLELARALDAALGADNLLVLCEHFSEGEILISRALRELESAGYLERRRERTPTGQVRTRTYFYAVPVGEGPEDPPEPPKPRPRKRSTVPETRREAASAPAPEQPGGPEPALTDADPEAVAVLTALRRVGPRLVLTAQEAARLAPAVTEWLAAGVGPREITELLTVRLPDRFRARPASVLAFRLRETPLPVPPRAPLTPDVGRPVVLPFQTCDGCERAFRAPEPGHCRSCRDRRAGECPRAAG